MTDNASATLMPRRVVGLVVRELAQECVILDPSRDIAVSLNETAAGVFAHCDGETARSAVEGEFGSDRVQQAIDMLLLEGLVKDVPQGIARRHLIKVGVGAAIVTAAAPVVIAIALPSAAAAASGTTSVRATTITRSPVTQTGPAATTGTSTTTHVEGVSTTRAPAATAGGGLAYTGADTAKAAEVGVGLLAAGTAALVAAKVLSSRDV